MGGRGWAGWSGVGGWKWDNCNSIINKYIFKKKKKKDGVEYSKGGGEVMGSTIQGGQRRKQRSEAEKAERSKSRWRVTFPHYSHPPPLSHELHIS